jgi:ElaB/YqjD/DUF883 family membrane-anchored ribosome-binding protein
MSKHTSVSMFEDRLESLKESVRDLVDAGGERAGVIRDSVVAGTRKTGSLIKAHPVVAIAIAFGIGYVAMRLMRR